MPPPARTRRPWRVAIAAALLLAVIAAASLLLLPGGNKPTDTRTQATGPGSWRPKPMPTPEELAGRPSAADGLKREDIPSELLEDAGGGNTANPPPELVAVLGSRAFRHRNKVFGVCFSPDGTLLATCEDKSSEVKVWDAATGRERIPLSGPSEVRHITFRPDGNNLATACQEGTARIWDLEKREVVQTFKGHTLWVRCVNFSPKGDRLVTASQDRAVRAWDVVQSSPSPGQTARSGCGTSRRASSSTSSATPTIGSSTAPSPSAPMVPSPTSPGALP